jgi:hypothetical protein
MKGNGIYHRWPILSLHERKSRIPMWCVWVSSVCVFVCVLVCMWVYLCVSLYVLAAIAAVGAAGVASVVAASADAECCRC